MYTHKPFCKFIAFVKLHFRQCIPWESQQQEVGVLYATDYVELYSVNTVQGFIYGGPLDKLSPF